MQKPILSSSQDLLNRIKELMPTVYHGKKGLHIVVMYLVIGNWRFPWNFRALKG